MSKEQLESTETAASKALPISSGSVVRRATFDEVWDHLRQFMPDDFSTQQAIIVMDGFGWIDNGPCTCGLEIYGDPCPHHSQNSPVRVREE